MVKVSSCKQGHGLVDPALTPLLVPSHEPHPFLKLCPITTMVEPPVTTHLTAKGATTCGGLVHGAESSSNGFVLACLQWPGVLGSAAACPGAWATLLWPLKACHSSLPTNQSLWPQGPRPVLLSLLRAEHLGFSRLSCLCFLLPGYSKKRSTRGFTVMVMGFFSPLLWNFYELNLRIFITKIYGKSFILSESMLILSRNAVWHMF